MELSRRSGKLSPILKKREFSKEDEEFFDEEEYWEGVEVLLQVGAARSWNDN